jgi:Fe-S-cluster containining protein
MGEKTISRHFSCTSCGKCCDRGPEMELGEATALADKFITRATFKLHSLPLDARTPRAAVWWKTQGSSLPMRKALDEAHRHMAHFSVSDKIDRANQRSLHLTISALPFHLERGKCPALSGEQCAIYEIRPLTCRTVPFHYSRPQSTLTSYLDSLVGTPGYRCNTTRDAPQIFQSGSVVDSFLDTARKEAVILNRAERPWKEAIVAVLNSPDASKEGFPTYQDIVRNSDIGATTVSMRAAWIIARRMGILTQSRFDDVCEKQVRLLQAELGRRSTEPQQAGMFGDMLQDYGNLQDCSNSFTY